MSRCMERGTYGSSSNSLTTRERVPRIHRGCADNKVVEHKEIGASDEFERMNDQEMCDDIRRGSEVLGIG